MEDIGEGRTGNTLVSSDGKVRSELKIACQVHENGVESLAGELEEIPAVSRLKPQSFRCDATSAIPCET